MPRQLRLPDATEFRELYLERRLKYSEMVEYYRSRYNLDITASTITTWRNYLGIPASRQVWSEELVPWALKKEHRNHRIAQFLRMESRRRNGEHLRPGDLKNLDEFLDELQSAGKVIDYYPEPRLVDGVMKEGFDTPLRRPEDTDIIRWPARVTRRGGRRD